MHRCVAHTHTVRFVRNGFVDASEEDDDEEDLLLPESDEENGAETRRQKQEPGAQACESTQTAVKEEHGKVGPSRRFSHSGKEAAGPSSNFHGDAAATAADYRDDIEVVSAEEVDAETDGSVHDTYAGTASAVDGVEYDEDDYDEDDADNDEAMENFEAAASMAGGGQSSREQAGPSTSNAAAQGSSAGSEDKVASGMSEYDSDPGSEGFDATELNSTSEEDLDLGED